jgi:hypothetical protein
MSFTEPAVPSTQTVLARFDDYLGAQAAVDRLSDEGFPVERVSIAGRDVSLIEDVRGRLTKSKATVNGLLSGLWFGLLLGLLFALFAPAGAWLGIALTAVGLGALWGALFGFVGHWATRGQRDFASTQSIRARYYEVLVEAPHAAEAARVLGIRTPPAA